MKYASIVLISLSTHAMAHTQGKWVSARIAEKEVEKAALLIPVIIGNKSCFMQLDTGAPNFVYWNAKEKDNSETTTIELNVLGVIRDVEIGVKVKRLISSCAEKPIGTVGNQNF